MDKTHATKTDLKSRGWTDAMVARLLGDPDFVKNLGRGKVAHLYDLSRVVAAEGTDDFRELRAKATTRSAAGRAAAEARAVKLLEYVQSCPINLERYSMAEISRAISAARGLRRSDVDSQVWDRWCVNALRHEATQYDAILTEIEGRPGITPAYIALKNRVLTEIARAYPRLAAEAARQRLHAN